MITLPRSLARWSAQLQLFPEDTASLLGRLLLRLAPSFDALVTPEQEPTGDVDGFDGIGNRGSYERLLAGEWLLQKYAPLEFLRRAAGGELSFFQLALRRPALPESTLVLFDAGPDQLGDCRLAQLALLVLLLQRAESQGHDLHWQHLHRFGEGLQSGLSEQAVRGFLRARTAARSSPAVWQAWAEHAKNRRVWLIGPATVTALGGSAFARVTLHERVAHERAVDVSLESGTQARRVALPLPEPPQCARLIRDPFESAKAGKVASDAAQSQLLLSPKGNRLYYRNARAELVAIPIANSQHALFGSPRRYAEGHEVVISSVGGKGRKLVWLAQRDKTLSVGFSDQRRKSLQATFSDAPGSPDSSLLPLAWFPGDDMAIFQGGDRALWRADFRTQRCARVAEGARSWLQTGERHFVAVDRWLGGQATSGPCVLELTAFREARAIRGPEQWQDAKLARIDQSTSSITLGYEENGVWRLQNQIDQSGAWTPLPHTATSLHAPASSRVLGVEAFMTHQQPGLWLLEGNRREVNIVRRNSVQAVLKTSSDIVHAYVATAAPILAVATAGGELLVVDASGTERYRGSSQ
jgi:hypothetical protein